MDDLEGHSFNADHDHDGSNRQHINNICEGWMNQDSSMNKKLFSLENFNYNLIKLIQ